MGKKQLRRELVALEQRLGRLQVVEAQQRQQREKLMEDLASAGLILLEGDRTHEDRLRAARAGALVFDDVAILAHPVYTVERDTADDLAYGFRRTMPGPIRATLSLEMTGDPEILDLLAERARRTS